MKYTLFLLLLLPACKKDRCYQCTTHFSTGTVTPPPGQKEVCGYTDEEIAVYEQQNSSTVTNNGAVIVTVTECRIK